MSTKNSWIEPIIIIGWWAASVAVVIYGTHREFTRAPSRKQQNTLYFRFMIIILGIFVLFQFYPHLSKGDLHLINSIYLLYAGAIIPVFFASFVKPAVVKFVRSEEAVIEAELVANRWAQLAICIGTVYAISASLTLAEENRERDITNSVAGGRSAALEKNLHQEQADLLKIKSTVEKQTQRKKEEETALLKIKSIVEHQIRINKDHNARFAGIDDDITALKHWNSGYDAQMATFKDDVIALKQGLARIEKIQKSHSSMVRNTSQSSERLRSNR